MRLQMKSQFDYTRYFKDFYLYNYKTKGSLLIFTCLSIFLLWGCLDPIRPPLDQPSVLDLTDTYTYSTPTDENTAQSDLDQFEGDRPKPTDQLVNFDQMSPMPSTLPVDDQGQSNSQDLGSPLVDQILSIDQGLYSPPNDQDLPQDEDLIFDQSPSLDQGPLVDALDQNIIDPSTFPEAELSFDDDTCYPLTDANHWTWIKHPTSPSDTVMINDEFLQ